MNPNLNSMLYRDGKKYIFVWIIRKKVSLINIEVSVAYWLACRTVVATIAGSNPAEAFGFFMSVKNPSVCLLFGWGSKAGGPMS